MDSGEKKRVPVSFSGHNFFSNIKTMLQNFNQFEKKFTELKIEAYQTKIKIRAGPGSAWLSVQQLQWLLRWTYMLQISLEVVAINNKKDRNTTAVDSNDFLTQKFFLAAWLSNLKIFLPLLSFFQAG